LRICKSRASVSLAVAGTISQLWISPRCGSVGIANVAEPDRAFVGSLVDDEGAPALTPRDQALALHFVERLAHGSDADAELARKLDLIGDCRSRLPRAGNDTLHEHILDLEIEGARRETSNRCHNSALEGACTSFRLDASAIR
jgi:hypothetical protein